MIEIDQDGDVFSEYEDVIVSDVICGKGIIVPNGTAKIVSRAVVKGGVVAFILEIVKDASLEGKIVNTQMVYNHGSIKGDSDGIHCFHNHGYIQGNVEFVDLLVLYSGSVVDGRINVGTLVRFQGATVLDKIEARKIIVIDREEA